MARYVTGPRHARLRPYRGRVLPLTCVALAAVVAGALLGQVL